MSSIEWLGKNVVDGEVQFRIGRDGNDLVAEWCGLCELRSDRLGSRASFVGVEGADARTIAKIERGLAAALVRHLRGGTSLHASAVARDGRGFAFVGPSGSGKSTMAAWLCRYAGYSLVADDILRVDFEHGSAVAVPVERDHWLDPASASALGVCPAEREEKTPFESPRIAIEPAPLVALVSLAYEDASAHGIERVRGQRVMELLAPCIVRFVLDEPAVQVAELVAIERLLDRAPLYEARATRRWESLRTIAEALEELL